MVIFTYNTNSKMSSKEQEVGTTKQDDDKPETKTSQEMETTVVSKDTPDSIQKDCGDTKVKLDDLTTKPIGSNKTSDDDDDDEMQLRWDDDDEELNNETPNVKETVSQTEDDVVLRDTGMLENPSTSLVSAVKELESALIESNKEEFDPLTSNKFENSDGAAKNDQETENTGANSSKEILDNIDEIIGKDDTSEIKDDQEHSKTSSDSSIQPNKTDDPKAIGDLEVSKMNVGISFNLTENNKQSELQRSTDFNNLDDTTDSIDKSNVLSSTVNDSLIESDFKFEHGLKKPDMMLEIPTQEIIECLDDFEDSDCEKSDDKNEGIDISTQINSLEGDIDSKIMDDEIQLVDQQINENISDVMTKVQDGKDPDLDVTEVSKNEDLSQKDVEMGDVSEKSDIVPLTNESIKLADKQIVMENPEAIEESNSTGTFSKAVDISTTNDENKKLSEEDSLMEMDESNIMLKNDVTNNDDIEPSKFTEIPAEKINETVSVQATEQDIFATQGKTGDSPVEPKQTIHVEENKNKSKTCDDIQETDLQVSHKKFEEDPKLSESKDNDVTLASDDKSDNVSPKDPEPSENKLADLKSLQSEEPLSKSTLDRKPDTEVTESFETEKREIVEPVLDQEVDTEPPKDAKPSDNAEPMSTSETLDTVTSKAILDQKSDTEQPSEEMKAIESIADQPSTSKDLNNASDQVPDTTDEVPEVEDSLGLLAESSRVMEDDEEGEEEEEGDADDDEDFDQDDESSNQMTAEHSEDSSAQPDKEDGQPDQETPTAEEKQFNFAVASIAGDVAGVDTDETIEDTKVSDDITAPVEVDIEPATTPAEVDVEKEEIQIDKETVEAEPHTEIETVNLSDTSDKETEAATNSILKELLMNQDVSQDKKLPDTVVELEGSSSEDDVQEVNKTQEKEVLTDVKKEETKLTPQKDVKTKGEKKETGSKDDEKVKTESKPDSSMEVFNLDSDEDVPVIASEITIVDKPESNKCINPCCPSGASAAYVAADVAARAYFDVGKRGRDRVCVACARAVADRSKGLVAGIKELTPLLDLDLRKVSSETVEISDSDSDDGEGDAKPEVLGGAVKFLEDNLADVINETWIKYKLDERLTDAQAELNKELQQLEADSKEIDTMLNECQVATDLLRNQLYATFEPERRELTAIGIVDTPTEKYSFCETASGTTDKNLKRRISSTSEQPAKRPAIPLGYTPLGDETKTANIDASNDDDKDVSVVKLSVEAAPSDLPPPGEITRPRLGTGMSLFAMRNSFCTWVPGRIVEVLPKNPANTFTMCRVRFEIRQKIATRVLSARCLAYLEPADVRLTIGTRVIALSKENVKSAEPGVNKKSFYSGIVAEIPNPVNSYRYLIFFDHGYAQYVHHRDTRVVCESSNLVWEEVHPNSREFVKQYLIAYPERPMVRLHAGQKLKTEWNGKWWVTKVLQVDASLVEVSFEDNRTEWIYRGSTRLAPLFLELQAAERQRARPLPRSNQRRMNMPYVEYTRSEEQNKADSLAVELTRQQQQQNEELRRQRAVAKKSTALPITSFNQTAPNLDSVTSRVVYYTPKNAVKPYKMTPHTCSPKCKRTDVLALKDLRTYNPLAKPLLSGWERQIVRFKGQKEVMYRAPCGRRVRSLRELHRYLRLALPDVPVDLFDFGAATHCLAEFVLNKCLVGKKDLSHGKENVPVPCVNYYDESLPEFCSYNTERTPTAGVPLNLDPEFLCGCDCTDDCQDKSKCACWKMTLEGARTIGLDCNVGYQYKRLPEPLPSGIYECNSRCKCKHTCLNRVAQHPLQLKLQVFKTLNRGWGIRALNDVPKGAFLCVYAGNLLTDATANLDGLNEGDEYLAELDYIEVVEQMKEGYEEDIPEVDKKLDRKASDSSSENESSEEEESNTKGDKEDDDFQPGFIGLGVSEFSKRLRKRDRSKKKSEEKEKEKGKEIDKGMEDDGCITISDDEEAKEPTRFMAQSGIGANEFVSKYKSVRTLYGKDEACYIMDAKVQGNIGRYLNHSCTPNVFVQNVFVDTHDPRFPWVAFFALSHIRAGTELTWNYNYDVGSVPDKVLYCYCGAPNCRGRLL